jgi:hypothetical protein
MTLSLETRTIEVERLFGSFSCPSFVVGILGNMIRSKGLYLDKENFPASAPACPRLLADLAASSIMYKESQRQGGERI